MVSQAGAVEGELMLVISRKLGEKLKIGDNVEVTVLEISGSRVVLGIDAPREIAIRRVGPPSMASEEVATPMPLTAPNPPPVAEPVSLTAAPETALPFEYPARAVHEVPERRAKTPIVTVRRSRKITLPIDGEAG